MSGGLRIALVGATGTLGSELVGVLEEERLPVAELRLFAGERSLGSDVEFQGDVIPVETKSPTLQGMDLLVICTPDAPALELIRTALQVEVACLDLSGALVGSSEVPLVVADLGAHDQVRGAPLLAAPSGPALAWALVLSALQRAAGLERVVGTILHSASAAGRRGIEALSTQTIALLNQRQPPESDVFPWPVAFDCLPHMGGENGAGEKDGAAPGEARLVSALRRLLGPDVGLAVTSVQVPTFAGEASSLAVQTERTLEVSQVVRVLEQAPGVELWRGSEGPSTRDTLGCDTVLVGRLRPDGSLDGAGRGLLMWLAADPVRLAAVNAVKLARARFSLE